MRCNYTKIRNNKTRESDIQYSDIYKIENTIKYSIIPNVKTNGKCKFIVLFIIWTRGKKNFSFDDNIIRVYIIENKTCY